MDLSSSNSKRCQIFSKHRIVLLLIFAVGLLSRIYRFGTVPSASQQDEAFAWYNAWSLLNFGTDSAGYHNPVYLFAWGSGMNALETYLMIPFIALFGSETWVIRLPQLIVALITLPVIYKTALIVSNNDRLPAMFSFFILAICPWHVMLSRWGLESNLLPGFFSFAFYFFLKGITNSKYYILSALMFGLTLYTYAVCWPYVPLFIMLSIIYLIVCRNSSDYKLKIDRHIIVSVIILALLAAPLILFLLVNFGIIDEIKTSFISIPKLEYFRGSEMNIKDLYYNLKTSMRIIIYGTDNLPYNTPQYLHLLYWPTLFFIPFGIIELIKRFILSLKSKKIDMSVFILFWLFIAFLECITVVEANANRINLVFIPLIISSAIGIKFIYDKLKSKSFISVVTCIYIVFFALFEVYYFTSCQEKLNERFEYKVFDAISLADEKGETIYFVDNESVFFPSALIALEYSPQTFLDTVVYEKYPAMYLKPMSLGKCRWGFDINNLNADSSYLMNKSWFSAHMAAFVDNGFSSQEIGKYVVCWKQ